MSQSYRSQTGQTLAEKVWWLGSVYMLMPWSHADDRHNKSKLPVFQLKPGEKKPGHHPSMPKHNSKVMAQRRPRPAHFLSQYQTDAHNTTAEDKSKAPEPLHWSSNTSNPANT